MARQLQKKSSQKSFQCKTGSQNFFLLLINEYYENNEKELKIFLSKMLIKLESSPTYAHQLLYENCRGTTCKAVTAVVVYLTQDNLTELILSLNSMFPFS